VSAMEPRELSERPAGRTSVPDGNPIHNMEPVQVSAEAEVEPEVIALAGQVKEALAPVRAPEAVRDKLRVELLEVAQHHQCQDVRVEAPPRHRGLVIGAAVALAGGVLHLLRSRISGRGPEADR
jgi:hypothetical protein